MCEVSGVIACKVREPGTWAGTTTLSCSASRVRYVILLRADRCTEFCYDGGINVAQARQSPKPSLGIKDFPEAAAGTSGRQLGVWEAFGWGPSGLPGVVPAQAGAQAETMQFDRIISNKTCCQTSVKLL